MADETKPDMPDFTVIFMKMREASPETLENIAVVEEQAETIRLLQQAMPDNDVPYVSTFMSA